MNTRQSSAVRVANVAAIALAVLTTGCLERELKPLNPCLVSGVSRQVKVKNVDKVDLLFMVDNSNSMAGEQASLREQFPKVIQVLTTGNRFPNDPDPFPAVKDLHVGVVSSDMGIPGVEFGSCHLDGGDDGRLQNTPRLPNCAMQYPLWLSYTETPTSASISDPTMFADAVGCIATLGTGGCGFEQQLESPFKALWPRVFTDKNGNVAANPYTFISTKTEGLTGKGDVSLAEGGNAGFLRNDPAQGISLIAIVIVTDEEDCSVSKTDHLIPSNQLPDTSPYKKEIDINLRCFNHPEFNWPLRERYLNGFRMLRQGNEDLVVFAAITGVPTDLVSKEALPDFKDDVAREAFYDTIMNDSRMMQRPDSQFGTGMGNLEPSCRRTIAGDPVPSTAFPPRRIVELARAFGPNGIVQSICQDDFGPAMEAIIDIIANQLSEVCLPRKLVRQSNGKVACNVVWELPAIALPGSGTPTQCTDRPFLGPVDEGRATKNSAGGNNCKVLQLAAVNKTEPPPGEEGWFYDDFSEELKKTCNPSQQQRVAFTAMATPRTGVTVKLECLNETQRLASTDPRTAPGSPEIGSPCGADVTNTTVSGDAACIVQLLGSVTADMRMFCHPDRNVCVRQCTSSTDCPPAWVCDDREARPYCVNPTCGVDSTGG